MKREVTKSKNRMYHVYHIRPVGETDTSKFYIGTTKNNLEKRLGQHMCSNRPIGGILRALGRSNVEIVELHYVSSKDAAYRLEALYRPLMNMGWNVKAGGESRTVKCPICGKYLPKRATGTVCADCHPTKFAVGNTPANKGKGMKAVLKSPEGIEVTFSSMADFCKEHNLIAANVRKVIKGQRKHTHGWTLSHVIIEG